MKLELDLVGFPVLGSLREYDCYMFEAIVDIMLNCNHAWTTEQDPVSRTRVRQRYPERVCCCSHVHARVHTRTHMYVYTIAASHTSQLE